MVLGWLSTPIPGQPSTFTMSVEIDVKPKLRPYSVLRLLVMWHIAAGGGIGAAGIMVPRAWLMGFSAQFRGPKLPSAESMWNKIILSLYKI